MDFLVLSSSRGTTFQAVIDAMQSGALTARCMGLISDRDDRGCVAKAQSAGIPVRIVGRAQGEERQAYDRRLEAAIEQLAHGEASTARSLILATLGWMSIFSPWFVRRHRNRIINVHPSLLPAFPGRHAVRDALAAGARESGMTIHVIDEGVDTGPVLLQKSCPVLPDDTEDTLRTRIQELEKTWYPQVLQMVETGELRLPP